MPAPVWTLRSERPRRTTTHLLGAPIPSRSPAARRPDSPALPSAQGRPQRPTAPKGEKVPDRPVSSSLGSLPGGKQHRAETTVPRSAASFRDWPFPDGSPDLHSQPFLLAASALQFYMF